MSNSKNLKDTGDSLKSSNSSKILFQLSGSIACYKACEVISRLIQLKYDVQVACSSGALEFIGLSTLEGLSGKRVFTDLYETGRQMDHIYLSRWADLAILCPASANQINSLAAGLASDVIGTLFLTYDIKTKPYLIAPAMNSLMMAHPSVQDSLSKLKNWGARVLDTANGHQACGDFGFGRLLEPDQIVDEINKFMKRG
jgi:phosphopantothenoylcysteine synthetase/decarboxylase